MKSRGLLVAAAVLAALTATLYWSNRRRASGDAAKPSLDTPPKILSLKEADISRIEIQKKDAKAVTLVKDSEGKWRMTSPESLPVDSSAASSLVSTLASLNVDRVVEERPDNLAQYGLDQPALVITTTEKTQAQKLLIGDETPTAGGAYARLDGDPRVFTIASYNKNSLDKTANDLRDKRLLTVDSSKISRVELLTPKQALEFGRNKDQWQILKPRPLRADSFEVDNLVRQLTEARMDLSVSEEASRKGFASGAPLATVRFTTDSGTQELQIHKKKDDCYAKSSVVAGVYKVSSSLAEAVGKKLDDFRNRKLFDFGFTDPGKVEIHDGVQAWYLTRSGQDWWSGEGKKLENAGVETLLSNLRGLRADKFADSGFGEPVIRLAVTSDEGKRVERVVIAKSGDGYVARRENESSLYVLGAKPVEDLRKSAADLKPAAEPKK
jgi:hypothetical protein